MTDPDEMRRPTARPIKRKIPRVFGDRRQPTPEEIAERNATATAQKIRAIFARLQSEAA